MNRRLFVGNLSFNTEESTLQDLFSQAGPVESVRVMRDQATGRSRHRTDSDSAFEGIRFRFGLRLRGCSDGAALDGRILALARRKSRQRGAE